MLFGGGTDDDWKCGRDTFLHIQFKGKFFYMYVGISIRCRNLSNQPTRPSICTVKHFVQYVRPERLLERPDPYIRIQIYRFRSNVGIC